MPKISASPALSRLRILDLSRVRAGPTCVKQFADFGADVIKIESPPGVDPNEAMGGPRPGPAEPAPQEAGDDAQPQASRGARSLCAPGEERRRGGRELSSRREVPPR